MLYDMIRTVKLADGSFDGYSLGYGGENILKRPKHFEWDRSPGPAKVKVFTDSFIGDIMTDGSERVVGLLTESPAVRAGAYDMARKLLGSFDTLFTCSAELVRQGAIFYPIGGSWIREWGAFEKTKDVSVLVSAKVGQEGHRLRHEVAKMEGIEAFGAGVHRWVESKAEALRPFRYSIVIENCRHNWYFTEKLIDCISQGTVPIYWGSDLDIFFNMDGIITFETIEELTEIVGSRIDDYGLRASAIAENIAKAREFQCAEDWLWERYQDVLS